MQTSSSLQISDHAVERYRERAKEDPLRQKRSIHNVKRLLSRTIKSHKFWPVLEKLALDGLKGETTLNLKIYYPGALVGRYGAIIEPHPCRTGYVVPTLIRQN